MLDTNIVSDLIRNPAGTVAQHIAEIGEKGLAVSIVTAAELRFGAAKRGSARLIERVEAVLKEIPPLALDVPADTAYAGIRAELESAGRPIGPNDYLIAAHACATGATLVTANTGEFGRIGGLKVENWLASEAGRVR
ncbi:type II toxin-antitoxin system VapC family toxin [Enterovirga rhinocerotis]|nr:type II toxin-antitoxin system VapC family toxin [Enterovirga rhinocerotis]